MVPRVEVRNVSKRYGRVRAVDGVSLNIQGGEVLGLLGPNGAGKSTLVRLITGLTKPTTGTVLVAGHDVRREPVEVKRLVGLAPEMPNMYGEISARDNLVFSAKLHDVPRRERERRIREVLDLVGLARKAADKVGTFSKGMKKRLDIAAAMLHDPPLLVLDEPVSGLDVQGAKQIWDLVSSCRDRGTTVLLATHFIHEADKACDRVAVMHEGKLLEVDTPAAIKGLAQQSRAIEVTFDTEVEMDALKTIKGVSTVSRPGGVYRLVVDEVPVVVQEIVSFARSRGLAISSINTLQPSLEDAFVRLTGMDPGAMEPEGA